MADEDRDGEGPSLELPSLRFGRRHRKRQPRPRAEAVPEPEGAAEPEPRAPDPEPVRPPEPSAPPLFVDEVAPVRERPAPTATVPIAPVPVPEAAAADTPRADRDDARRKVGRRSPGRPGALAAALITGVLVGIVTVGLTWGSQRLCEVVRGTSSCGGPGYLILLAIMVLMVLLGAVLLRALGVPQPGSTSLLAMGLLAVLTLLFLIDLVFSSWMILVVPVLTALTFALAHWVTATAYDESPGRR
jgi:hypothetical protein